MPHSNPPSYTGGVKPMAIEGRMAYERERLMGMSDAERAWRAQWLKDQILAPDEPKVPEHFYKERYNILRRFYMYPLNHFESALAKTRVGPEAAHVIRAIIGRGVIGMGVVFFGWYHFKYNRADWTKKSSWRVNTSRPSVFPNDPGYPNYTKKKNDEYYTHGFEKSPI